MFLIHTSVQFQFSLPCVRSDCCYFKKFFFQRNFNSRSLCGERFVLGSLTGLTAIISILAPCLGSDLRRCWFVAEIPYFNSRSPHGERWDNVFSRSLLFQHFNSRSPRGERYHGIPAAGAPVDFNSRPLRGERFCCNK